MATLTRRCSRCSIPNRTTASANNYLGLPFDLSKVLFIATANMLDSIPGPLRDRMEIIELTGYTEDEKVEIAKRYLIKRQLEANGLQAEQASVSEAALHQIVRDYTRKLVAVRSNARLVGATQRGNANCGRLDYTAGRRYTRCDRDLGSGAFRKRSRLADQHYPA